MSLQCTSSCQRSFVAPLSPLPFPSVAPSFIPLPFAGCLSETKGFTKRTRPVLAVARSMGCHHYNYYPKTEWGQVSSFYCLHRRRLGRCGSRRRRSGGVALAWCVGARAGANTSERMQDENAQSKLPGLRKNAVSPKYPGPLSNR